ncbi:MAG: anaerobic ribonucleoside-triphosphate reductase activating protein [Candidatus Aenigmatarchaeota archaeon]
MLKVGGIIGLSTVDYPGRPAAVVFLYGCNFRCPFCHNFKLVEGGNYKEMREEDILAKVEESGSFIEGVVITGGEPTLQDIRRLCRLAKDKGLSVKLDTNGSKPEAIRELISEGLVDFIAMDVKNTLDKKGYLFAKAEPFVEKVKECLELIISSKTDYEIRIPLVEGINDRNIDMIAKGLRAARTVVLEQFRPDNSTLDKSYAKKRGPSREKMVALADLFDNPVVKIRTAEAGEEKVTP